MSTLQRGDVERFAALVAYNLGLRYEEWRFDALEALLVRRLEATGCRNVDAYRELLNSPALHSSEIAALSEELTVGETFFFRNADQFRALTETILPMRIVLRGAERKLRILSIGCSTGEEPYSLAILIREALPDVARWDIKITAVDVNRQSLAKAALARFTPWSLRAISDSTKSRWFRAEGNEFVLMPEVASMVTFEWRNLAVFDQMWWSNRDCDLVLCRNVLMYLTTDIAREVVRGIRDALSPQGYLFLGHAETLRGMSAGFRLCNTHDTFYYAHQEGYPGEDLASIPQAQAGRLLPPAAPIITSSSWLEQIRESTDRIAQLDYARRFPQAAAAQAAAAQKRSGASSENPGAGKHSETGQPGSEPPPKKIAPPKQQLGVILEAMRQERFGDAFELLAALPSEVQTHPDALLMRAVLLTNNGKLEEAESDIRKLLAADELNAGAHYLFALCREHAGDLAGAAEHDRISAYLDAGFAMPHLHLGILARRSGDASLAERELLHASELLAHDDAARLLLFGGGFSRETLIQLCSTELGRVGGSR